MRKRLCRNITVMFILILMCGSAIAKEIPFTQEDRDRLIRVETKLEEMNKRFEQRFEQIDKRFEQIDKRFEQMMTFMWMLVVIFSLVTAATIGFAIWDRRTMIRPFETKVKPKLSDSFCFLSTKGGSRGVFPSIKRGVPKGRGVFLYALSFLSACNAQAEGEYYITC